MLEAQNNSGAGFLERSKSGGFGLFFTHLGPPGPPLRAWDPPKVIFVMCLDRPMTSASKRIGSKKSAAPRSDITRHTVLMVHIGKIGRFEYQNIQIKT